MNIFLHSEQNMKLDSFIYESRSVKSLITNLETELTWMKGCLDCLIPTIRMFFKFILPFTI
jgi:hypothetical protein